MKILLVGYGKMGKAIEEIALGRGHEVVGRIGSQNRHILDGLDKASADVAIEFSTPQTAFENIKATLSKQIPTVSGTTAWLDKLSETENLCKEKDTAFLHSSNFSLGVNLFFELNRKLAELMKPYQEYECSMQEIHHTQKLDAPSGTAVKSANDILPLLPEKNKWSLDKNEANSLWIDAVREENVPGTHTVKYESAIDFLEIKHEAKSRKGFAYGALLAAEWLSDKKGIYSMKDMLGI